MPAIDLTPLSYFMAAVVAYYGLLFLASLTRRGPEQPATGTKRFFVLVIPAHDEELVIAQTLESLQRIDHDDYLILVMNDGSTDRTSEIAGRYTATGRVLVHDRPREISGKGKGAVLNDALRVVTALLSGPGSPLRGWHEDDVVLGVVDADGQLEPHALRAVGPLFDDPRVGAAQIGVRIANADEGLLPRLQDLEFIGFSLFVQQGRSHLGSVGLGGNGQFTRLSALLSLGRDPWTQCLTEDLDLGLSLVERGWRTRFTAAAFVAQQGLRSPRLLLRQRTRWIQGHYQCWRHLGPLLRADDVPVRTRLDLAAYLVLVTFVVFVFVNTAVSAAALLGIVRVHNEFLSSLPPGIVHNLIVDLVSLGPLLAFLVTYQRHSRHRLAAWELPAYGLALSLYGFVWIAATFRAWGRIALRRGAWAKTPRVAARAAV